MQQQAVARAALPALGMRYTAGSVLSHADMAMALLYFSIACSLYAVVILVCIKRS